MGMVAGELATGRAPTWVWTEETSGPRAQRTLDVAGDPLAVVRYVLAWGVWGWRLDGIRLGNDVRKMGGMLSGDGLSIG